MRQFTMHTLLACCISISLTHPGQAESNNSLRRRHARATSSTSSSSTSILAAEDATRASLQREEQNSHLHRRDEKKKSNDVGLILVPLTPFSIHFHHLSLSTATDDNDEQNEEILISKMIDAIYTIGYSILSKSEMYAERFEELDLGNYEWSVFEMEEPQEQLDIRLMDDPSTTVYKLMNINDETKSREDDENNKHNNNIIHSNGQKRRHLQQRQQQQKGTTAVLTLAQSNATAAFAGSYYQEDPTPEEITSTLVQGLMMDSHKQDLVTLLHPLDYTILGSLQVDDLEVMAVAEEVDEDEENDGEMEEGGVVETIDSGNGIAITAPEEENRGHATNNNGNHEDALDDIDSQVIDKATSTQSVEASNTLLGSATTEEGNNTAGNGVIIIPIVIALMVVSLVIFVFVYQKRRYRPRSDDKDQEQRLQYEQQQEQRTYSESSIQDNEFTNQHPSEEGGGGEWSKTLSIPTTTTNTTSTMTNKLAPSTKNNIDQLLADFCDGDSSFISEPSETGTNSVISGFSLSSYLGGGGGGEQNNPNYYNHSGTTRNSGAFALEDVAHSSSHLSNYSHVTVGTVSSNSTSSVDKKTAANEGVGRGYLPNNLRKQESFEGQHRSISAMAQMSLRKDILHVVGETSDSKDVGASDSIDGGGGTSRTMSPKKISNIMEQQKMKDKKEFMERFGSRHRGKSGLNTAMSSSGDNNDVGDEEDLIEGETIAGPPLQSSYFKASSSTSLSRRQQQEGQAEIEQDEEQCLKSCPSLT